MHRSMKSGRHPVRADSRMSDNGQHHRPLFVINLHVCSTDLLHDDLHLRCFDRASAETREVADPNFVDPSD